jgi:hypothetical protein
LRLARLDLPWLGEGSHANLQDAIASFLAFKTKRSVDVQRKARLLLDRLKTLMEGRKKSAVGEVTFSDLVEFRAGWTEADTTHSGETRRC